MDGFVATTIMALAAALAMYGVTRDVIFAGRDWNVLARRWRATRPPRGQSLPWMAGRVGRGWNKSGLNVRFDQTGMWLTPALIFRLGRPGLFFPWDSISGVIEQSVAFSQTVEIVLRDSDIRISLVGYGARNLTKAFNRSLGTARPANERPA
jgi:hypothetical protein